MFKELTPLSPERHRALRLSVSQPYDFVAGEMLIPVTIGEVDRVARDMPIVFPRQGGLPQALVGFEPGKNIHVDASGKWLGRYIPAHIRRYPFVLSEVSMDAEGGHGDTRRFALHIDTAAKHLGTERGERLFDDAGAPTPTLKRIQQVLTAIQQDAERTQALVTQLDELGLLHEQALKVSTADGATRALTGMRVIDRARLAKLAPDALAALNERGALALIYAHLLSLTNLQDGWIARQRAGQQASSPAHGVEGALNFDNIDWNSFGKR